MAIDSAQTGGSGATVLIKHNRRIAGGQAWAQDGWYAAQDSGPRGLDEHLCGHLANFPDRLGDQGEARFEQIGPGESIETHKSNVLWDAQVALPRRWPWGDRADRVNAAWF